MCESISQWSELGVHVRTDVNDSMAAVAASSDFDGALAVLRDASGDVLPDIWSDNVLPFLTTIDILHLSSASSALLPVATAGVQRLQLCVPEEGTVD